MTQKHSSPHGSVFNQTVLSETQSMTQKHSSLHGSVFNQTVLSETQREYDTEAQFTAWVGV